jgi:outer membrane protein TolC
VAAAQPPVPALPAGIDLSAPLTLSDCARLALALNPSLAVAGEQTNQAQAGLLQARAPLIPYVSLDWDVVARRSLGAGTGVAGLDGGGGQSTSRNLGISVSQTFYRSGLRQEIGAARAGVAAARWAEEDSRRLLLLSVAQGYYATLAAQELAAVAQRAVQAATQHLDAANARIEAGTAARADRFPFEVELQQALLAAIAANNQVNITRNSLKRLLGLPATTELRLAETLSRPALPGPVEELRAAAFRDRPDLRELQEQLTASQLNWEAAKIQRGPVLSASGTDSYGSQTDVSGNSWQVQVGVSLPVFDTGAVKASRERARAALAIARESLRQAELQISQEVEDAYLSAAEANARIETAAAAVTAAQVAADAAQERYRAGVGTVIEVTDAEQNLRQAEADRVKALYDYNSAVAALKAAIGAAAIP